MKPKLSLRLEQNPPQQPNPIPKVGDGITRHVGSDRYVGTIISVSKSGKSFVYQEDRVKTISGSFMTGDWKGEYEPNPDAEKRTVRWTIRGGVGGWRYQGQMVGVGFRNHYIDPCF